MDRYKALAARDGVRIHYLIDTHRHADHFSATQQLARQLDVPVVMHSASPAPFMSLGELKRRLESGNDDLVLLDVRERDAYEEGRIPGARHLPRGQLELRVNQELTDPTRRILSYCEFGRISTLAAATLRQLGVQGAVALDGGMKAWRESGFQMKPGKEP